MITMPTSVTLDRDAYFAGLKMAAEFHGHLCFGMFNGVKIAQLAKAVLGYDKMPDKDLIVITEIDRCLVDAVMVITGVRLGRRTLKLRDFGKFAATFCSLKHGQGLRISMIKGIDVIGDTMEQRGVGDHDDDKIAEVFADTPWEKMYDLVVRDVTWNENELPGKPKIRETCSACGETVMDGKHLERDGKFWCVPCAAQKVGN